MDWHRHGHCPSIYHQEEAVGLAVVVQQNPHNERLSQTGRSRACFVAEHRFTLGSVILNCGQTSVSLCSHAPRPPSSRTERSTRQTLTNKHGLTEGCPGCKGATRRKRSRLSGHTEACRARMHDLIMQSEEGKVRINRASEIICHAGPAPHGGGKASQEELQLKRHPKRRQQQGRFERDTTHVVVEVSKKLPEAPRRQLTHRPTIRHCSVKAQSDEILTGCDGCPASRSGYALEK